MKLDRADVDKPKQTLEAIDPEPCPFTALPLLDGDGVDRFGQGRERSLVEERLAVGVPDQRQRSIAEMRQRLSMHRLPVCPQLVFRGDNGPGQEPLDVRIARHASCLQLSCLPFKRRAVVAVALDQVPRLLDRYAVLFREVAHLIILIAGNAATVAVVLFCGIVRHGGSPLRGVEHG